MANEIASARVLNECVKLVNDLYYIIVSAVARSGVCVLAFHKRAQSREIFFWPRGAAAREHKTHSARVFAHPLASTTRNFLSPFLHRGNFSSGMLPEILHFSTPKFK
jgi:hypothetical protein